jgi:hypothetical protein
MPLLVRAFCIEDRLVTIFQKLLNEAPFLSLAMLNHLHPAPYAPVAKITPSAAQTHLLLSSLSLFTSATSAASQPLTQNATPNPAYLW